MATHMYTLPTRSYLRQQQQQQARGAGLPKPSQDGMDSATVRRPANQQRHEGHRTGIQHLMNAGASILGCGERNKSLAAVPSSSVDSAGGRNQLSPGRRVEGVQPATTTSLPPAETLTTDRGGGLVVGSVNMSAGGAADGAVGREEGLRIMSDWEEFWDEEVEASYYYNSVTRQAQWVRPDGW